MQEIMPTRRVGGLCVFHFGPEDFQVGEVVEIYVQYRDRAAGRRKGMVYDTGIIKNRNGSSDPALGLEVMATAIPGSTRLHRVRPYKSSFVYDNIKEARRVG